MVRTLMILVALETAVCAFGQVRFCRTYQDFCNDKWEYVDSISITHHSKSHQFWWGGNDYKISCKDKDIDNVLKKEAFVVAHDDSLYVNCRNLRYEKCAFGKGYVRAKRIGNRSLLVVNRLTGRDIVKEQAKAGAMFGSYRWRNCCKWQHEATSVLCHFKRGRWKRENRGSSFKRQADEPNAERPWATIGRVLFRRRWRPANPCFPRLSSTWKGRTDKMKSVTSNNHRPLVYNRLVNDPGTLIRFSWAIELWTIR